jgi:N-methylhydantoinase B/oxoprolinase/acetone carboxylase alpha subunit/N-methylhydantoinase A/oxoprolinase/acetone carboxylase beta subunit
VLEGGQVTTAKVPTTPADQSVGVAAGIAASGVDPSSVATLAHGMTVATNALLERRGARCGLVTTQGFRDLIEIARQDRPSLYRPALAPPAPLVARDLRWTVAGRMGPEGELAPIDEAEVHAVARELAEAEVEAVAVCLLFSFLHPAHERRVGELLREALPDLHVSLSCEVLPEMREYERTSTTAADAYLAPKLAAYLGELSGRVEAAGLPAPLVMQSSGGVVDLDTAVSASAACVLSGPAGGVVGAAHAATASGRADVLTFDMGGTSTDVALVVGGKAQVTTESVVAGVPIGLPMVDVHTVSAGGGSVAWADAGGALRVGPRSAGAEPGPAAYGRGGEEPTVTDAHLVLGHLADGTVLGESVRLDRAAAEAALERLGSALGLSAIEVAAGAVEVADAAMAAALRVISVERGLDPREFALVAFGGAGGLHACSLAEELEMDTVLVPRAAGVLSALGLALSDLRRDYVAPLLAPLADGVPDGFEAGFAALEETARKDLEDPACERRADVRYGGQSFELMVAADDPDALVERFGRAHEQRPRLSDGRRAGRAGGAAAGRDGRRGEARAGGTAARGGRRVGDPEAPARRRMGDRAGARPRPPRQRLAGPRALRGRVRRGDPRRPPRLDGRRRCHRHPCPGAVVTDRRLDPVTLSVMTGALTAIAEEMGAVLIRGAYSSNIKERRDCSAALFDADGRLVAQAAHIPVHLGAMPEAVAQIRALDPVPGDVFAVNDPYSGGTHLPDITLVSPLALGDRVLGFAVTRAHHSDVGGMSPGSMPSDSREILQEGLVIPPVRLVARGEEVSDVLALILANVRTPAVRRGDLRAQIAANRLGERRFAELAERRGEATVLTAFAEVLGYAERRTREAIAALPDGRYEARSEIEGDGTVDEDIALVVQVRIDGEEMEIDFAGTAGAVPGNVNCPLAVTRSACYFALRCLLDDDVPANAGTYAPLTIRAPEGSLVHAQPPSAVVAGNVETSQRIADTLLLALAGATEVPAQGQGTMNNLVIGGLGWTYYETIGGGQGAARDTPGPSGVHVGMSNTRNTPVEAFELEYPMRVERYELRRGSGGAGQARGGDGIVRSVRVLERAALSLLTDRRRHAPQGLHGGKPGACGRNLLNGEELPPKASRTLESGDVVTVETPGGGGWGPARPG